MPRAWLRRRQTPPLFPGYVPTNWLWQTSFQHNCGWVRKVARAFSNDVTAFFSRPYSDKMASMVGPTRSKAFCVEAMLAR